jgi:hypothetical protein
MSMAMARSSGVPSIALTSFWKCFGCTLCDGTAERVAERGDELLELLTFTTSGASWMRNSVGVP